MLFEEEIQITYVKDGPVNVYHGINWISGGSTPQDHAFAENVRKAAEQVCVCEDCHDGHGRTLVFFRKV